MQVVRERHRILLRVGAVVDVIVGVFHPDGSGIVPGPLLRPAALDEDILVGLPLRAEGEARRTTDDRPRESALGAIGIDVQAPVSPAVPPQEH